MRLLTIILFFIPALSFGKAEIIEAGANGFTHIDPLRGVAYINATSTLVNDGPHVTARCPTDTSGRAGQNYFLVKVMDERGVVRDEKRLEPCEATCKTCEQLIAESPKRADGEPSMVACQGRAAVELTVADPPLNGCYLRRPNSTEYVQPLRNVTCNHGPTGAAPTRHYIPFSLRSPRATADAIRQCGGDTGTVILRDESTDRALLNNNAQLTQCTLDRRRVTIGDGDWDGPNSSPYVQLWTANDPAGFNLGAIQNPANPNQPNALVNYNFDFAKNQWCQHILPDQGNTAPTCDPGYSGMTFPMNFAVPNTSGVGSTVRVNGVVQLGMENGKPVAYIGHPTDSNPSIVRPVIDRSRPVIRIRLARSTTEGVSTIFDAMDKMDGTVRRTLAVQPTYTLGSQARSSLPAGSCDAGMCLRAPTTIAGSSPVAGSQCSANRQPLDITSTTQPDICYSCNGVTPGTCGVQRGPLGPPTAAQTANQTATQGTTTSGKEMITSGNYEGLYNRLNACKANGTADTTAPAISQ